MTIVVHLELQISPKRTKFEIALKVYSGTWGKLIHEKHLMSKISWHCPFQGDEEQGKNLLVILYQTGYHLPNSLWAGRIKLFPPRECLVSDIPARNGNVDNLFYGVYCVSRKIKYIFRVIASTFST
jgi:hypothetical protein